MNYNFDEIIQRENTDCVKYDLRKKFFGDENVIPLWVADMDFASPDFIKQAIIERAAHGIYGYTFPSENLYSSIANWLLRRHSWNIDKNWILFTPGIVPALNLAIIAFTQPGEKVIVQPPVYFPFFSAVKNNNRNLVYNQLQEINGRYEMDFRDLEKKIDKKTKLLLLCHPHNPIGRVWEMDELNHLIEICADNNITIVSDEIHSDLMLYGKKHTPLASVSETAAKISVTCMAPSKTFNLAGLASSALIIPDPDLKRTFEKTADQVHIGMGNIFGMTAMQAAYEKGMNG
jgi:cysteine-S-conjugate beta-lyase